MGGGGLILYYFSDFSFSTSMCNNIMYFHYKYRIIKSHVVVCECSGEKDKSQFSIWLALFSYFHWCHFWVMLGPQT